MSQRTNLSDGERFIAGLPKTVRIRVRTGDGELLDLDDWAAPIARCKAGDGTYVVPTAAKVTPQVGADRGVMTVTFTAADFAVARVGVWTMDVLVGASALEEPISRRYTFELEDKETVA